MAKRAAEEFRRDAATETLEVLHAELEALDEHEERQNRLDEYAQEIKEAKAEADRLTKWKSDVLEAMDVLNEASMEFEIAWLPKSIVSFELQFHPVTGNQITYESQHTNPGEQRIAELEAAVDSRIGWLQKIAAMTPEQIEESRHAASY